MKVSLIIAAGGRGSRFLKRQGKKLGGGKLFFALGQKPILTHALESFRGISQIREIVVALPRGTETWVKTHVLKGFAVPPGIRLVRGGATRAESVWKALSRTSPRNPWVLVHDGARPFPPRKALLKLFRRPSRFEGALLARPVVPTLKRVFPKNGEVIETVDRSQLFEAETPQLVRRSFLIRAYRENPKAFLATDESSLVESLGGRMKVVPHSGWNVKITTPEDLKLAEAYHSSGITVGFGRDTHRLVKGRKLYLGGVHIPFDRGALGHSDGDALLHAVSDAILGALGSGDIGDWFSDKSPRTKGIRSEKILRRVLEEAHRKAWTPAHVDSVLILERPRLGRTKKIIRKNLAKLLGLEEAAVSIKAKTMEGLGPEGEGLAVTCEALVQLRKFVS